MTPSKSSKDRPFKDFPSSDRPVSAESEATGLEMPDGWRYERTVEEIEATIAQIENGDLDLEAVFEQFAIAIDRLQQCDRFLKHHQHQVSVLIETLGEGGEKGKG